LLCKDVTWWTYEWGSERRSRRVAALFNKTNHKIIFIHTMLLLFVLVGCSDDNSEPKTSDSPSPLVLVNGNMIDGTGSELIKDAAIVIREGKIVTAGTADTIKIPENADLIDLNGATILPGFINTHVHHAYDEETLRAFAQAGVTTVRDMQDSGEIDWQWFVRRDELLGDPRNARLLAVGPMVTVSDGYPVYWEGESGLLVTSPEHA
jgi:predicted amidohydrolase YtcJ